jgi:hypothetical protein
LIVVNSRLPARQFTASVVGVDFLGRLSIALRVWPSGTSMGQAGERTAIVTLPYQRIVSIIDGFPVSIGSGYGSPESDLFGFFHRLTARMQARHGSADGCHQIQSFGQRDEANAQMLRERSGSVREIFSTA